MKKYILILTLLFFCFGFSSPHHKIIARKNAGSSTDWSTIGFFWRCESETLSATLDRYGLNNSGDNTGAPVNEAVLDAVIYKYGSYSCDFQSDGDYYNFATCSDSQVLGTEGRLGFWFHVEDWTDAKPIMTIEGGTVATNSARLFMVDTDDLQFTWIGNSVTADPLTTTALGLTTGVWYYIEYAFKQSTPYREIFVNGVSKGSSSSAMTAFSQVPGELKIGDMLGGGDPQTDFHMDNIIFSTDSTLDLYVNFSGDLEYGD